MDTYSVCWGQARKTGIPLHCFWYVPGMRNSHFFNMLEEMCIRGFLVARSVARPIINCVALMKDSGLPCFDIGNAVGNLTARFHLDMTERQAAAHMKQVVHHAYCKWSTVMYDHIQDYTY